MRPRRIMALGTVLLGASATLTGLAGKLTLASSTGSIDATGLRPGPAAVSPAPRHEPVADGAALAYTHGQAPAVTAGAGVKIFSGGFTS